MPLGKNLGINTNIPSLGITSNHPSFGQNQTPPPVTPQNPQPPPQTPVNPPPVQQGIPVIEIPWHKAGPDLKNIK